MSVTGKALWYIESHLTGDLSLETIAKAVGVSRFHLSRAFGPTGCPLAAYIRGRRLSEAAKALVQGAPDILAVALDAGYGSHEAFTRAFRQQFDVTPEQVRASTEPTNLKLMEPFPMNRTSTTPVAAPRLVHGPAILIFGLGQHYNARQSSAGIPSQWDRFLPHLGHIPGQVGPVAYGVMCDTDDSGNYEYICGVEVTDFPSHPVEFSRLRIPAESYAVFEHRGHISSIQATFKTIWNEALPASGYRVKDAPFFERYGEQFDGRTGLGGLEIWIPVQI
jgi:AraC family transcriptional regulator